MSSAGHSAKLYKEKQNITLAVLTIDIAIEGLVKQRDIS